MKLLWLAVIFVFAVSAEEKCFECHLGNAESKRGGIEIDPDRFKASAHASLDCSGCHMTGFEDYPHKGKKDSDIADCTTCHSGDHAPPYDRGKIETDVKASIHAQLVDPGFKCINCHWPHDFVAVAKMPSIGEAVKRGNAVCLECHAKPEEKEDSRHAWQRLADKHVWIPMWELHTKAARCVDCHTPGNEATIHRLLPAAEAQKDCVACHSRNSLLLTKLYKHVAKEARSKDGIVNAVMFNNGYMIGATKSEWLDRISIALFGVVLAGVGLHGSGRYFARKRRRS